MLQTHLLIESPQLAREIGNTPILQKKWQFRKYKKVAQLVIGGAGVSQLGSANSGQPTSQTHSDSTSPLESVVKI